MLRRSVLSLISLILCVSVTLAQKAPDPKADEAKEKLRKQAVEFLRETMTEVGAMRSLENRLSFSSELASLMWYHDEKEARAMFQGVITDFKRLIFDYDQQLNALDQAAAADGEEEVGFSFFSGVSSKLTVERKVRSAMEMRQQIAMSLAEHDADLALSFFYDSFSAISNADFRAMADQRNDSLEVQLMAQIAETNAAKATQLGLKSLSDGFSHQHLELLKKIYAKDNEKGIEFGQAVLSKYKSTKLEENHWLLHSLIDFGGSTAERKDAKPGDKKKPLYTPQELRDLTEILARAALDGESEGYLYSYMATFEKYTPARAAQIKAKHKSTFAAANAANSAAYAMANAANAIANAANTAASGPDLEARAKAAEARAEAERKLMEEVGTLGTKTLPKEERERITTDARKMITRSGGADKKIIGLSMLAAQVAKAGDKELASELMKEAEGLTAAQPKNYQEYMLKWMLITGYAQVDTDRAFPLVTDTILRLNGTIEAFVKAAEFIDVREEIIADGEVQVGNFGGSMVRSLTKELKIAEPTLRSLTRADFSKTKAVTNSFDRPEVRILAKMLIIRTVLGEKEGEKTPDVLELFNTFK